MARRPKTTQQPLVAQHTLVTPRPWLRRALFGLLLASVHMLVAAPAWADDESEFRAKPTAAQAEKITRTALSRDQPAKAMNWLERIGQTPGATQAQLVWAAKTRTELRWRLNDAHVAPVQIRVTPAAADVVIDGMLVPFHTAMHTLWLPEGAHSLEVIAPDFATHTQSIGARVGEREVYEIDLESSKPPVLQVHMIPDGEVLLNGGLLGPSTKVRFVVRSGRHMLELRAPGHVSWQQEMTLRAGDVKYVDVQLKPNVPPVDPAVARRAHQIDRPLLPSEIAQSKERSFQRIDIGGTTLDRNMGTRVSGDAASPEFQRKARAEGAAKAAGTPKPDELSDGAAKPANVEQARAERQLEAPRQVAERTEPSRAVEPNARETETTVTEPAAPSGPGLSRTTKGWIYGGVGIAAVGAGLALSYLGAQDAETANQLPRGAKTYADVHRLWCRWPGRGWRWRRRLLPVWRRRTWPQGQRLGRHDAWHVDRSGGRLAALGRDLARQRHGRQCVAQERRVHAPVRSRRAQPLDRHWRRRRGSGHHRHRNRAHRHRTFVVRAAWRAGSSSKARAGVEHPSVDRRRSFWCEPGRRLVTARLVAGSRKLAPTQHICP